MSLSFKFSAHESFLPAQYPIYPDAMTGIKEAKCVLVVGATAGIGRALALAIHDLDSKPTVIVAGRRQERLDELARASDRIKTARVDINTTYDKLKAFVEEVLSKHPQVRAPRI